jgi:hypothetical protein
MGRRLLLGVQAAIVLLAAGCESVSAPDPTAPTVHVSGRVLAYYRPTEFSAGPRNLVGWIDAEGNSRSTGPIPFDESGRFNLTVERGARVRLYAGGGRSDEIYQPCAVTILANHDVTRDVTVVYDYNLIGAAVPATFLAHTRILTGKVYETVPGSGRQPVRFATVYVGGIREYGQDVGWPIANTRTDNDGRYIICGLEGDSSATVYVTNPTHETFVSTPLVLRGDAVLDIELKGTG